MGRADGPEELQGRERALPGVGLERRRRQVRAGVASDPSRTEIYFYLGNSYDNMFKASHMGEAENDSYIQKAIANYEKSAAQDPSRRCASSRCSIWSPPTVLRN